MTRRRVKVYCLKDPRDGAVRYVGVTTRTLARRLETHLMLRNRKPKHPKTLWFLELERFLLSPLIELLEMVDFDDWQTAERRWIAHYAALAPGLTNLDPGGNGHLGRRTNHRVKKERVPGRTWHSMEGAQETRDQISETLKSQPEYWPPKGKNLEFQKEQKRNRARARRDAERKTLESGNSDLDQGGDRGLESTRNPGRSGRPSDRRERVPEQTSNRQRRTRRIPKGLEGDIDSW